MRTLKNQVKKARDFYQHGEIKRVATEHNIPAERAYVIARGRVSPHPAEVPFVLEMINRAMRRANEFKIA